MIRRVLQLITSTDRRGAQVFAVDLAKALRAEGFEVETAALVRGTGEDDLDVPTLGARRLGVGTLRAIRKCAAAADLVVAHGSTTLPASVFATIGRHVPIVYRSIGDIEQWNQDRVRSARSRVMLRRTAMVVALTGGAADRLVRFGVPASHVRVIPNGVPEDRYPLVDESARSSARAALGIDASTVAAFVGALEPEKDVGTAIRAVARIDGLHLVIAGDGTQRPDLERLARDTATGRVHFLGWVPNSAPVLAAADLLLLPSLTEGLPGVAIEAGFTGIPTVASDVGFVDDAVRDGETGFLVAPGDVPGFTRAIGQALGARDALGGAARVRCSEQFGIRSIGRAWADLLRERPWVQAAFDRSE